MFTGLVQDVGEVASVSHTGRASRITLRTTMDLQDAELGESIAVDGACYTVVEASGRTFAVDVSPESLDRTTAGQLKVGDAVHLERAMRLADRLGGHLMLGHVDAVGRVERLVPEANAWHLTFSAPPEVTRYLIPKGSIAVNGVSLTVNACDDSGFGVTIIPHTAQRTTLARLSVGTRVNLEADVIGKYVAKLLGPMGPGTDERLLAALRGAGFLMSDESEGAQ